MKVIVAVLGAAFLIITVVLISIVFKGAALRSAGVIKPAQISEDPTWIGRQVAIRLYPDFHAAKNVIWRIEGGAEDLAQIPRVALEHYRGTVKPTLHDLRTGDPAKCEENCWYIRGDDNVSPESESTVEIFVQYFDRDEKVPEACETEKILTMSCMRPVSVREVRRKLKTPARHFFMRRYLKSQFYLFIERN